MFQGVDECDCSLFDLPLCFSLLSSPVVLISLRFVAVAERCAPLHTIAMSSLVFSSVEHVLVRRSAAAAARKLNVDLTLAYNVILGGCVALFALRHLLRIIGRSKKDKAPRVEFVPEPKLGSKYDFDGNEDLSLEREAIRLRSRWSEFERFLLSQLPRRWRQFGLRSPLQVIIFVLLFVLNAAFTLVSRDSCSLPSGF